MPQEAIFAAAFLIVALSLGIVAGVFAANAYQRRMEREWERLDAEFTHIDKLKGVP